ncbi:zinc ribbon domain-containing protein, partial [Streptococcus pneumoniae]|uniref:zinc ribbon domain-containing protein n=1 Tax=Streptococcus pneumoniae TaxID=1313 RepID=UPI002AB5FB50
LKAVYGLRFVPSLPKSNSKPIKLYRCQSCQQTYQRKRRIDTQRYRCGLCRGKLLLVNQPED